MDELVERINAALRARGWSAQQASIEAVGHSEYVRGLRRGRGREIGKLRSLCDVLGLEFYVGPPRELGAVDERRLEAAIDTAEQLLAEGGFVLSSGDKAGVIGAVYAILGEERSPATAARLRRLVAGLAGRIGSGSSRGGQGPS